MALSINGESVTPPLPVMMGDIPDRPRAGAHSSDGWEVDSPWHTHDMHQLLYAFEGAVEVEGEAARYIVPRQYAAWIPAGTVHRTTIRGVRSGSIFLGRDMVSAAPGSPRIVPVPTLMREMIIHAMRWPIDQPADAVSAAYFDCFAKLCVEWTAAEVALVLPGSADPRIQPILAHTLDSIATVTMSSVCAAAGMSERSLRRHFHKALGITWEEYRKRLRICLAIDALDHGDKPIGTIAADIGYTNQAAFAAAFRAIMHVAPQHYRRLKDRN